MLRSGEYRVTVGGVAGSQTFPPAVANGRRNQTHVVPIQVAKTMTATFEHTSDLVDGGKRAVHYCR